MTAELIIMIGAALVIGSVLGLTGAGGSVLAVPVLVYLLGINPVKATAYSLFIIGVSSLIGSVAYMMRKSVNYKMAVAFGIPSIIAVFSTRRFLVPAIPEHLISIGQFELTKDTGIMLLFSALMIAAAYSMIRNREIVNQGNRLKLNWILIIAEGIVVGLFTGLVGAGGGFLIIPALVVISNLPIKIAVGTSLLIIASKSLIGFSGDIANLAIDWPFLAAFTAFSVLGIFIGHHFSRYITNAVLRTVFGWFIIVMASCIIGKELIL